jgi:hypothetical protein
LEKAFECVDGMFGERDVLVVCLPSFSWWDPLVGDGRS